MQVELCLYNKLSGLLLYFASSLEKFVTKTMQVLLMVYGK